MKTRQDRFLHEHETITLEISKADWLDLLSWIIPPDAIVGVGPSASSQEHYAVRLQLPAENWWSLFDQIHDIKGES